jgi:DNA topoisomerase-1
MRLPATWNRLRSAEGQSSRRRARVASLVHARSRRGGAGRQPLDPATSAKVAGLRYVNDARMAGIRRIGSKHRVRYVGPSGRTVHDPAVLQRIRALAIPPAWTDVWICPDANGHLQATGRDARRRKQYRYHPRWREVRDEVKYGRLIAFAQALPRMRQRTERDVSRAGLPREKVLAAVVQLLEKTLIRVGNEEYARENGSVGLTTMKDGHAKIRRKGAVRVPRQERSRARD